MNKTGLLAAEALGTFILVMGGPGTAVLVPGFEGKAFMVAIAFGLSLLVAAYAIGPVSGCHINPAVSVGLTVAGKLEKSLLPAYVVGQLVGAAAGGAAILGIAGGKTGGFTASVENFAVNGWDKLSPGGYGFGSMVIVEIVLTALLVYVVLATGHPKFSAGMGGLTAGSVLALIHMISIPVDNTSVNPARSFAMALYAGGDAMSQLWAFFVFPIVGGIIGALVYGFIND